MYKETTLLDYVVDLAEVYESYLVQDDGLVVRFRCGKKMIIRGENYLLKDFNGFLFNLTEHLEAHNVEDRQMELETYLKKLYNEESSEPMSKYEHEDLSDIPDEEE